MLRRCGVSISGAEQLQRGSRLGGRVDGTLVGIRVLHGSFELAIFLFSVMVLIVVDEEG